MSLPAKLHRHRTGSRTSRIWVVVWLALVARNGVGNLTRSIRGSLPRWHLLLARRLLRLLLLRRSLLLLLLLLLLRPRRLLHVCR